MLAHQGPHDAVLNQHRHGLPPRSPETSDPLSTFPSGDTPLAVPYFPRSCLKLRQLPIIKRDPTIEPPSQEGVLLVSGTYHLSSTMSL
jgi:hypothetical protein